MMDVTIFTYMGEAVDDAITTYVNNTSAEMISLITPVVIIGLTLYLTIVGYQIIGGYIREPFSDFCFKSAKIILVTAIALNAGIYQNHIKSMVDNLQTDLANTVSVKKQVNDKNAIYQILDESTSQGFDKASKVFELAATWNIVTGIIYTLAAGLIMLSTIILTIFAGAYVIVANVAIAVLLGIGPLFIVALLFPIVARFFDSWAAQLFNYIFLIMVVTAMIGISMAIFDNFIAGMVVDTKSNTNQIADSGILVILSIVLVILIKQAPSLASGLAGGMALGSLNPLQRIQTTSQTVVRNWRNRQSTK